MTANDKVVIVDYNIGNLTSIQNMLKKLGTEALISDDAAVIENATKLILPGVGSFDHGISNLKSASYFDVLEDKVLNRKTPVLGVCLGMQLLAEKSEEGTLPGLGWIKGKVTKFDPVRMNNSYLKVPHMGWSEVSAIKRSKLLEDWYPDTRFYFVHSYHMVCEDESDVLLQSNYGYDFTAAVERDNIVGVQFHPEKSHKYGLRLYENFIKYY